MTKKILANN